MATVRGALLAVSLGLAAAASAAAAGPAAGSPAKPVRHAILVSIDSLRADHLSFYGYPRATTPELEALIRRRGGVIFRRETAVSPSCHPSHAAMMTGLYPIQIGIPWCAEDVVAGLLETPDDEGADPEAGPRRPPALDEKKTTAVMNGLRLPETTPLLAEALRAHGLRTGGFVSIWTIHRRFGYDRGFERFVDDLPEYYGLPSFAWLARDRLESQRRQTGEATVDAALDFLKSLGQDDRAFLFVHFADTHVPYAPRSAPAFEETDAQRAAVDEARRRRYEETSYEEAASHRSHGGRGKNVGRGGGSAEENLFDRYDRSIRYVDIQLGRLLSYLETSGLLDDTLVIVTSDHGDSFGQHLFLSDFRENKPFFEHSINVWEETQHVPLIVLDPAHRELERRGANVSQVDLAPTILRRLGFRPEDLGPTAGRDLLSLGDEPRTVFFLTFGRGFIGLLRKVNPDRPKFLGFRRGDLKFFVDRDRLKDPDKGRCFLYDLATDPDEKTNLCKNDETARRHRQLLVDWYSASVEKRQAEAPAEKNQR